MFYRLLDGPGRFNTLQKDIVGPRLVQLLAVLKPDRIGNDNCIGIDLACHPDNAPVGRTFQNIVRNRAGNDPGLVNTGMMQGLRVTQIAIANRGTK